MTDTGDVCTCGYLFLCPKCRRDKPGPTGEGEVREALIKWQRDNWSNPKPAPEGEGRNSVDELIKSFEWYSKVFNGPSHEFEHWWRVEVPTYLQEISIAFEQMREERDEAVEVIRLANDLSEKQLTAIASLQREVEELNSKRQRLAGLRNFWKNRTGRLRKKLWHMEAELNSAQQLTSKPLIDRLQSELAAAKGEIERLKVALSAVRMKDKFVPALRALAGVEPGSIDDIFHRMDAPGEPFTIQDGRVLKAEIERLRKLKSPVSGA